MDITKCLGPFASLLLGLVRHEPFGMGQAIQLNRCHGEGRYTCCALHHTYADVYQEAEEALSSFGSVIIRTRLDIEQM